MNPDSTISAIRPSMSRSCRRRCAARPSAPLGLGAAAGGPGPRLGGGDQVVPLGDGQAHHAEAQEQRDPERQPGAQRPLDLRQRQAQQQAQQQADEQAEDRGHELGGRQLLDARISQRGRHDREVRQHREADDHPGDRPRGEDEPGVGQATNRPVPAAASPSPTNAPRAAPRIRMVRITPLLDRSSRAGDGRPRARREPSMRRRTAAARARRVRRRSGTAATGSASAARIASASEPTTTSSTPGAGRRRAGRDARHDRPREPEPGGLAQPAVEAADRAQLAQQADLADRDRAGDERPVAEGRGEGERQRQVEPGLAHGRGRRRGSRTRRDRTRPIPARRPSTATSSASRLGRCPTRSAAATVPRSARRAPGPRPAAAAMPSSDRRDDAPRRRARRARRGTRGPGRRPRPGRGSAISNTPTSSVDP